MDFVNKATAQLSELFRSLTPGTRIVGGLLLAAIAVSLFYLFQFQGAGSEEFLLDGRPFSASEMTAIETAFAKAGLAQSQIVGNRIRIPYGKKDLYLAALADNNALPADFYKHLDEATAADNPFASTKSLELRRWNAKQKELALIISRMRGIESATVQYDEESKGGLTRQKHKTAMVAVQTIAGALDPEQLRAIRNVVASAYAGLDRQSITITDMTSGLSYGGAIGPGGVPDDESLYASHKQKFERDWQRKITDQLSMIPGVVVGVNVELTPEIEHNLQTVKLDPKPVALQTSEASTEKTTQAPQIAGRPGAQSNGVGNQPVSIATTTGSGGSNLTETRNEAINLPGYAVESIGKSPLTPTMVTASIEVPASYFLQVWQQRNPPAAGGTPKPPDPAELAKIETETVNRIKETVRNLLPPVNQGTNPYPHIVVSTYTDLPVTPAIAPTVASQATTWLAENWQTVAVVGIGLMSLLMLRSMIRSPALPASPERSTAEAVPEHAGPRLAHTEPEPASVAEPAQALRRRFKATAGPDLRVELQEIVKENPDAAANILRSWIGDAA